MMPPNKNKSYDHMVTTARNRTIQVIGKGIDIDKRSGSMSAECTLLGVIDALIIAFKSLEETRTGIKFHKQEQVDALWQMMSELIQRRMSQANLLVKEQSNQSKTTSGECTESNSQDTTSITAAEREERLYGSTPNSET